MVDTDTRPPRSTCLDYGVYLIKDDVMTQTQMVNTHIESVCIFTVWPKNENSRIILIILIVILQTSICLVMCSARNFCECLDPFSPFSHPKLPGKLLCKYCFAREIFEKP